MVQKYQSPIRVYKYPFELVMAAYERRFPSCDLLPVFLGCEILRDETSSDGAETVIVRRCQLNVEAPYLLKKIIGVDSVQFIQKNTLDRRNRCLHIEAYNESFSARATILEKCKYYVHPDNSDWTCFEQMANLDVKSFYGFEGAVEKLAIKQYSASISKGKEIIEHFIAELKNEGITSLPIWKDDNAIEVELSESCDSSNISNRSDDSFNRIDELTMGASASNISSTPGGSNLVTFGVYQLETEYIQRFLGKLTVLEESKLVQLRETMKDLEGDQTPSDSTLLRFLTASGFDCNKARNKLHLSMQWRKDNNIDQLVHEYSPPDVIKAYFPGGWHHEDKEGRPLYILRLGQLDIKGIFEAIGAEGLVAHTLHVCEQGLQLLEEATRNHGRPIATWSLLVDMDGLNMRHVWRPGMKAMLRMIETVEKNYPETMGRVFIVRAPRVFPILFTLVGPFIDDVTRSKFIFYSGSNYLYEENGLIEHVAEEYFPDFLGGHSQTNIVEGGLVSKSLFGREVNEHEEDAPRKEDSSYQCATLGKNKMIHELYIQCVEPGSVLTWDFDVIKGDIIFTILFTKRSVDDYIRNIANVSTWHQLNYCSYVEPQITCRDGESVQGSHVTGDKGLYVLQWKLVDHGNQTDSPVAHIMYYTDCLSSADYRGSLSSLQSGTSSQTNASSSCASR